MTWEEYCGLLEEYAENSGFDVEAFAALTLADGHRHLDDMRDALQILQETGNILFDVYGHTVTPEILSAAIRFLETWRCCSHCHTCGAPMASVLDGEEWCTKCNTYRRYVSHGWNAREDWTPCSQVAFTQWRKAA